MAEVIVALDVPSREAALGLVDRLEGLRWAKVGSMLFVREGPALVDELVGRGVRVFLDLKWHDIPHTVAEAARAAAGRGVALASVHAAGGGEMIRAAANAKGGMRVAAVTVLTSHTRESYGAATHHGAAPALDAEVLRLGRVAVAAGADGIVASPHEAAALREALGSHVWIVVPGIRPRGAAADDQRRSSDPATAARAGATHLVVGRPIIRAENPLAVYSEICEAASCGTA